MAAFNADVLLDLVTSRAERELKKFERNFDRLERKTSNLDVGIKVNTSDIRRAERELKRLERTRNTALGVSGISGGGTSAGLLPGLAAGASASAGINAATKKLDASLASVVEKTKQARVASASFATSQREVAEAAGKLEPIQARIATNSQKIAELTRQRNAAAGQAQAIQTKLTKGQIKNADAIRRSKLRMEEFKATASDLSRKISDAEASQRGLNRETEKYARLAKGLPSTGFRAPGLPPAGGGGGGRGGRGGSAFSGGAAGGALSGLSSNIITTIGTLVGLNEALQETRRVIDATLARSSSEQRLRALTNGWDSYAAAQNVAAKAAERFNLSQTEAEQQIAQVYGRLRPLGLSLQEIESVYNGFNTAARLSGANAAESAGAFLQLSQALGAGALRGEEFNSVAEQAPAVLTAIAKVMGEPVGSLKELAKEGKITREVVLKALQDIEKNGAARLADVLDTPAQKLTKLNSRLDDLRVALGNLSLPTFISGVETLTGLIERSTKKVERYQKSFAQLKTDLDNISRIIPSWASTVATNISKAFAPLFPVLQVLKTADGILQGLAQRRDGIIGTPAAPGTYDATQGADLNMEAIRQMSQQADFLKKLQGNGEGTTTTDNLAERIRLSQQALELAQADLRIARATDEIDRLRAEAARDILQITFDLTNALEGETSEIVRGNEQAAARVRILERELELTKEIVEARKEAYKELEKEQKELRKKVEANTDRGRLEEEVKKQQETLDQLMDPINQIVSGANAIGDAFGEAFRGIVDGSMSAKEAFANMAKKIGDYFLDMTARMIAEYVKLILMQSILNALGGPSLGGSNAGPGGYTIPEGAVPKGGIPRSGYSEGGYVTRPTNATVGEGSEPEYIIPASKMAGAMSRYSSGIRGDAVISGAETEQGGAGGEIATAPMNFSFSTVRIADEEYVDRKQLQEAMTVAAKQGAKEGEIRALGRLRNSPGARRRVGI